jgi:WD40 repeat protein
MLSTRRTAIFIANQDFRPDAQLGALRGPLNDVTELTRILGSQDYGGFKTVTFVNGTSSHIKTAVEEELSQSGSGDLVVIYYSGHGRLDRLFNLYLATADTRTGALQTTSIPISHIRSMVANSSCSTVILILDCCYSGAATNHTRGDIESHLNFLVQSSGFYILSASSEIQTASESELDGIVLGDFTKAILDGLSSGDADLDSDGLVSLYDIFKYTRTRLKNQSPQLFTSSSTGDPIICKISKQNHKNAADQKETDWQRFSQIQPALPDSHRSIKLQLLYKFHNPERVIDVAFNRDDTMVATVCDDGKVRIYEIPSFEQVSKLQANPHTLRSASWSKGGREIATGDSKGRIWLWREGTKVGEMICGPRGLCCAQYSPDGMSIVSGSEDGVVSLWKPQQRQMIWQEKLHQGLVSSARFSSDGNSIVTASYDGQAVVISAKTGSEVGRFTRHSDQLTAAFFISSRQYPMGSCVSAGLNGEVCIWPIRDCDSGFVATRHNFWVTALTYCDNEQLVISGGYDAKIKVVDLSTGHLFEGAEIDQGPVVCVRTSHYEDILSITTHDGIVYFFSLKCT